ncbi:MAG: 3-hydroxyacyl-CoA dehydrogenase NAD-binding domain-containing protein [Acidiferrobacterales bacterium]|nr:3-hydroxyacyl-CoA dehydrogenase NAD-binding domain-containing protein [Acidiferrobacterales bacterium]
MGREAFFELGADDQERALRHVLAAEREARSMRLSESEPAMNDHVAVIGGGHMGSGIAYVLLTAGYLVTIIESDSESCVRAQSNVHRLIDASIQRNYITQPEGSDCRARLVVSSGYGGIADVSVAIEAVYEDMQTKQSVFKMLETNVAQCAILASNTSYLDLNEIASVLEDPSRAIGLHFFAPAHIMKLLEVIRGDATSERVISAALAIARRLGKVPVLAGVCDGFIGNRIVARYREAADSLLLDGALPWEVDQAMVSFGYPMGPYEAQDLSGLDIAYASRRRRDASRDPNRRYVSIADKMVESGRLGRKSGLGWYRYPTSREKQIDPQVEALILEQSSLMAVSRTSFSPDEVQQRLVLAMINEAADILHEGIANCAADIDLVTIFGYGFPRWRGGLMHYADLIGVDEIVLRLESLRNQDPVVWVPSALLYSCAAENLKISDYRA